MTDAAAPFFLLVLSKKVFFNYGKGARPDFQKIFMKVFQLEAVSLQALDFIPQGYEVQISKIIFQIVGGIFYDILEDFPSGLLIRDSK